MKLNLLLSVGLGTLTAGGPTWGPSGFLPLPEGSAAASHRSLQPAVGHVAAHRHVLVVFAGVKRHRSEAAVGDGLLAAGALHAVHVDGTGACGGGEGWGGEGRWWWG